MEHNRAVLVNLSSTDCMNIATGDQRAFLEKSRPNITMPFKVYICCSEFGTPVFGNDKSFVTDSFKLLKIEKDFERTSGMHKWNGKVIGEFICNDVAKLTDRISHISVEGPEERDVNEVLIDICDCRSRLFHFLEFECNKMRGYAWYISKLKFYDKPKEISDFCKPDYKHNGFGNWVWKQGSFLTQAPTNWCYVKDWFYSEEGGV